MQIGKKVDFAIEDLVRKSRNIILNPSGMPG